mmetsp:Transcript_19215/g.38961  ORF Transcript_19215/g.38961 Transcript_19215/m.38961 type:complete len:232 (-) Transcript_19215:38-733(-)|eukprot:CAMPEP_0183323644 /NCGR_PEP_ID=MMETSP0160_2-20130417/74988_1 /TAXON_ID=2839 ORGANISM="Odontella Sinensis, Strain Grunow 1884" /NCGR_SAMPLE_ID=MMETSP0160_2 /ASSEMBLY_ACC=CAM_ASM_000250 /LENGTH=231 /DNA_ID=CAMNT_0025491065 /DNA_START=71 /DNA_END=766 /DNA_ORIENTATION=-
MLRSVAASHESSSLRRLETDRFDLTDREIIRLVENSFKSYPRWLAGLAVTFGVLRARPINDASKATEIRIIEGGDIDSDREAAGVVICDAVFGLNLLTFGRAISSTALGKKKSCVTVDLPVMGGLLTLAPPGLKKRDGNGSAKCLGCVRFMLSQQREVDEQGTLGDLVIETKVAGAYRPAIAGGPPVSTLRKRAYLSTQSVVHAYVMWRFHGWCDAHLQSAVHGLPNKSNG